MKKKLFASVAALAFGLISFAETDKVTRIETEELVSEDYVKEVLMDAETTLNFRVSSDTSAKVVRGCAEGFVSIPSKIKIGGKTYTVTCIGREAFDGCGLTGLSIPASVTSIENYAFSGCTSLKSIEIPASVKSICYNAFNGCSSLEVFNVSPDNQTYSSEDGVLYNKNKTILQKFPGAFQDEFIIPSSVEEIMSCAFSGCTNLKSIVIPASVNTIGSWAFSNCKSLINVKLPSKLKTIESYLFSDCTNLKSIEISASVKSISFYDAFNGCSSLEVFNVSPDNQTYSSENGVLYNKNKTILQKSPEALQGEFIIPSSVEEIMRCAFRGCTNLKSIVIPASVNTIGYGAFEKCESLIDVKLPSKLKTIESSLFRDCTNLKSIEIPASVGAIEERAFENCKSLINVKLPSKLKTIESFLFYGCSSLKSIEQPANVEEISSCAFYNCNNLDLVIQNSEKNVKVVHGAFKNCKSVTWLK